MAHLMMTILVLGILSVGGVRPISPSTGSVNTFLVELV